MEIRCKISQILLTYICVLGHVARSAAPELVMIPQWLTILSWVAIGVALVSTLWLAIEQFRRPLAIWAYYRMGLGMRHEKPLWESVFDVLWKSVRDDAHRRLRGIKGAV